MSFLNNDNAQYLSARITQKGRKAIAKGDFQINYFQVGDSEFDYSTAFSSYTGGTQPNEKVFSPFDKETGVKYPLKLNSSDSSTYGNPVQQSTTYTIKNEMGPAGFVSNYIPNNTTIECETFTITSGSINGSNTITIPTSASGSYFASGSYVTLALGELYGETATIQSSLNSFVYKVTNKSGNVLTLDRNLPILTTGVTSFTGTVISNKCELEYPIESEIAPVCLPSPIDPSQQLNSWTLNTIWTQQPIGGTTSDEMLSGYTSNTFVSTKERLGYTSTGQTFVPFQGLSTSSVAITGFTNENYGTSFVNSYDEVIELLPSEQRCVAIIHYSELGDVINDPERFFKYDDYISTGITNNVATDNDDELITDLDYFEVYIPFLLYHRSTGITIGALFTMDSIDYYVKSTKNVTSTLPFRYLLDETNVRVGKVFYNNKIVVFDDQELVATLDYRSNRKYTLPAPKVYATPSDTVGNSSMLSTTGQTVWLTYMMTFTSNQTINALPCNYFNKVRLGGTEDGCFPAIPSQISFKFGDEFNFLKTSLNDVSNGLVANKIFALIQRVENITSLPSPDGWKYIDITSQINGVFTKNNLLATTFTIKYSDYSGATTFNLETHMTSVGTDYLGTTSSTTQPQFGDEQPFPGSVRLVRATDIEQMNFLINLPSNAFVTSQNPTCSSCTPVITEVQLLNDNKEPLVVAKAPLPIKRLGTQVLSVKLDF
jgi:hypothetical protein